MKSWPIILALFAAPGPAIAGYKLLKNDGFVSPDNAAFQGGFVDGECWGVVYQPDPGDYPFEWAHVDALIGGTTSHAMFGIEFMNSAEPTSTAPPASTAPPSTSTGPTIATSA